jgi:hypothetical protein
MGKSSMPLTASARYPRGISNAIQDLMKNAIKEQKSAASARAY